MTPERQQTAKQFARFIALGAVTTGIDIALHALLMFAPLANGHPLPTLLFANLGETEAQTAASPYLKLITSGIAIVLSFFLNRRYTFEIRTEEGKRQQFAKFLTISLVGLALNAGTFKALAGHLSPQPKIDWALATLLAAIINALWNFTGQKLWAFRQR